MIIDDNKFLLMKKKILEKPLNVKIVSGSMEPLIKIDERVKVEPCDKPRPFDVIVYHASNKTLICHFVWGESKAEPGSLLLQSLCGGRLDLPVAQEKILGRVRDKQISWYYKMIFVLKRLFV